MILTAIRVTPGHQPKPTVIGADIAASSWTICVSLALFIFHFSAPVAVLMMLGSLLALVGGLVSLFIERRAVVGVPPFPEGS